MPRDWGTSEAPETSVLELSTRRIQLCCIQACRVISVVYFFKNTCQKSKMKLGSPRQWMRLGESFSCMVSAPSYLGLAENYFCVWPFLMANPTVAQKTDQMWNPYFKNKILPILKYPTSKLVLLLSWILGCWRKSSSRNITLFPSGITRNNRHRVFPLNVLHWNRLKNARVYPAPARAFTR